MLNKQKVFEILELFHPRTLLMVFVGFLLMICMASIMVPALLISVINKKFCKAERREKLRDLRKQRRAQHAERSMWPIRAKRVGELITQFPGLLERTRTHDAHQALLAGRDACICVDEETFVRMAEQLRPSTIARTYLGNMECDWFKFDAGGGLTIESFPSIWVGTPIFNLPHKPSCINGDRRNETWTMQWST